MTGIVCTMIGATFGAAAVATITRAKKSIIANGNAQIDTAQYKFGSGSGGSSMLFDGTGDYLTVREASNFNFGSSDFTLEFWLRANNFSAIRVPFASRGGASIGLGDWWCELGTNGKIYWGFKNTAGTQYYANLSQAEAAFSTGVWYHIALVRSGTGVTYYRDGVATGGATTVTGSFGGNDFVYVGALGPGGYSLDGHIDEVRISNTARYTTNFTPSTTPFVNDDNTVLLIHGSGTDASTFFEDDNGSRRSTGLVGTGSAALSTTQAKFGNTSLRMVAANNTKIAIENHCLNEVGTGAFTIEFWTRIDSLTQNNKVWLFTDPGNAGRRGIQLINQTVNYSIGGTFFIQSANVLTSTSTWYHIALVRSGTTTTLYVDGTSRGSYASDSQTLAATAESSIANLATGYTPDGYLDEFRISKVARYTAAFTPPTQPFVNDSDTVLLIHFDGTNGQTVFRDDNGATPPATAVYNSDNYASYLKLAVPFATNANDVAHLISNTGLTSAATSTQGTSSNISGGGAFGGYNNSLLNSQTDQALTYVIPGGIPAPNSGTYVVEGWFAATDATTNNNWALSSADTNGRWLFGINSGTSFTFASENNLGIGSGWRHIAIVCDAGTKRLYSDGVYKGAWVTAQTTSGFSTLHVGQFNSGDSNDFRGRIQDLRVYVGTNKGYTGTNSGAANFALPNPILSVRSQKSIIANGNAQIDTAQSKFGGASALFDGTGDYLTVGNTVDNDLALTSTTWTVEYWARINAHAGAYQATVAIWDDVGSTGNVYYFTTNMYNATQKMGIAYRYNGPSDSDSGAITFGSTLATGTWQHHAFVRNGNTLTAYLDGVSQGTHDMTGRTIDITGFNSSATTSLKLTIGAMTGGGGAFNGWLDEIRISKTARYTANFTAPTAPFTNDTNTVLLIHADGVDASTVFLDDNGIADHT